MIKLNAKQRLAAALPNFMYEPTEQEVKQHKVYPQLERMAAQMVQLQHKMKSKLIAYDTVQRKIAKRLLTEETGLTFEFTEPK